MVCILDITVDKLKILSLCLDHETLIVQGIITPFMGQQWFPCCQMTFIHVIKHYTWNKIDIK